MPTKRESKQLKRGTFRTTGLGDEGLLIEGVHPVDTDALLMSSIMDDVDDLVWFGRHPIASVRHRAISPLEKKAYDASPATRVTVYVSSPNVLIREYFPPAEG